MCKIIYSRLLCTVAAEYIATGYKLSDQVLQRAIEIDSTPNFPLSLSSLLNHIYRQARNLQEIPYLLQPI